MTSPGSIYLRCGDYETLATLSIPESNLLAVASSDSKVRMYKHDTDGKPFCEFDKDAVSLLHLDGDIIASVDSGGSLSTWNVSTGAVLEIMQVTGFSRCRMVKLGATSFLYISKKGSVIIFTHASGRDLMSKKPTPLKFYKDSSFCELHGIYVAISRGKSVLILDQTSGNILRTLDHRNHVLRLLSNNSFLVVGCLTNEIHLRENGGNYGVVSSLHLRDIVPNRKFVRGGFFELSFASPELLIVSMYNQGIFFISIPDMKLVGRILAEETGDSVPSTTVLGDSRICIGGKKVCSILELPPLVRNHIQRSREGFDRVVVKTEHIKVGNAHVDIQNAVIPGSTPADIGSVSTITGKRMRDDGNENSDSAVTIEPTREPATKKAKKTKKFHSHIFDSMPSTGRIDLCCGAYGTAMAMSVSETNCLAVASSDSKVRVYLHNTDGSPFLEFIKHQLPVVSLLYIQENILASIDSGGTLFTWDARTGDVLETLELGVSTEMVKISSRYIVLRSKRGMSIMTHNAGRVLSVVDCAGQCHKGTSICGLNEKSIAVANQNCVRIMDDTGKTLLHNLFHRDTVSCITGNIKFIAVACAGGEIHLRENGGNHPIIFSLDLSEFAPELSRSARRALSFVSPDLLMVTVQTVGIFFVSIPKMQLVGRMKLKDRYYRMYTAAIFGETRICIGGHKFCYILELPALAKSHMGRLREEMSIPDVQEELMEVENTERDVQNDAEPVSSPEENYILPDVRGQRRVDILEKKREQLDREEFFAKQSGLIETLIKNVEAKEKVVERVTLELENQKKETKEVLNELHNMEMENLKRQFDDLKKNNEERENFKRAIRSLNEEMVKQKGAVGRLTLELEQERKKTAHLRDAGMMKVKEEQVVAEHKVRNDSLNDELEKHKEAVKRLTLELEQERKKTAHLHDAGMKIVKEEEELVEVQQLNKT